jgi:tetratricopeptide (TPR) repeat protein
MLLSLLLLMLAQDGPPQAAPNNIAPDLPAAIELSQLGQNAEALVVLQKIAAANPNDQLARLWIAQVHDRMGHPDLAEPVYHSIVLEDPRNVEALIGVGVTLLEQDQVDAGIDALERAEQLAPQNLNVLVALGDAYRRIGRSERSLAYFQRVFAVSPTPAHLLALEQARREQGNWVEGQAYDENFNGSTKDTRGMDITVNMRVSEALRVAGREQLQTKFGRRENRAGGGVQWRWTPEIALTGQVLVGTGNRVLPQADYLGQIDYSYHRATWTGAVRYFDFFGAKVVMVSPAVTMTPWTTWTFGLRYAMTKTDTVASTGVRGHTLQLRAAHQIRPRVWLHGVYTRGVENFENFSSDRIGAFHANTETAAVQVLLRKLTSIVGSYDYQRRAGGVRMGRANVAVAQSF